MRMAIMMYLTITVSGWATGAGKVGAGKVGLVAARRRGRGQVGALGAPGLCVLRNVCRRASSGRLYHVYHVLSS